VRASERECERERFVLSCVHHACARGACQQRCGRDRAKRLGVSCAANACSAAHALKTHKYFSSVSWKKVQLAPVAVLYMYV
jgi:hypothetical protein